MPSRSTSAPTPTQSNTGAAGQTTTPVSSSTARQRQTGQQRQQTQVGAQAQRRAPRSDAELSDLGGLYNQNVVLDKFNNRGSKETMQWVSQVTQGLEHKFTMAKSDALDLERLDSVYDLAMRVNDLQRFVRERGLMSAFMIKR